MARPEENTAPENPYDKARRIEKEKKAMGRGQLVTAAASERANIGDARRRGVDAERAIASGGGKAFAGAMGRTAGGVGSVGGLGTLQMGIDQARSSARSSAAEGVADARRKAQAADQEVVKFDIESEKSVDDLNQEAEDLNTKLKSIAELNPGTLWGVDESGMANDIEKWGIDTRPTKAQWFAMTKRVADRYGVNIIRSPKFGPDGRFAGGLDDVTEEAPGFLARMGL